MMLQPLINCWQCLGGQTQYAHHVHVNIALNASICWWCPTCNTALHHKWLLIGITGALQRDGRHYLWFTKTTHGKAIKVSQSENIVLTQHKSLLLPVQRGRRAIKDRHLILSLSRKSMCVTFQTSRLWDFFYCRQTAGFRNKLNGGVAKVGEKEWRRVSKR